MLVQVNAVQKKSEIVDPCAEITCASPLKCPAGFLIEEVAGHCCPYCVNPNIKVEDIITGPSGDHCAEDHERALLPLLSGPLSLSEECKGASFDLKSL